MTQDEALSILKMGYNVFLTGAPGSGKTFLLNKYIEYLQKNGRKVAVTASTGIAATHMNGVTIHSWAGLGIKEFVSDSEIRSLQKKPYLRRNIKGAHVLIIDEISILKPSQLNSIDRICQYFRASFKPFGGIQVVCSGDFFQLPPIQKSGEDLKFVIESSSWKSMDMKICYLNEQFRQKDKKLSELLAHMRQNEPAKSKNILLDFIKGKSSLSGLATKLYTHNIDVDQINNRELEKIKGEPKNFYMGCSGKKEIVESLKKSCLAPENLSLKIGAKVMFIKNNFDDGYVNGTQGEVVDFSDDGMPVVETLSGRKVTAQVANWSLDDENQKTLARIQQLPMRLAWAITVHKSQGMNLDAAEIDLSKCFTFGMGYVALSRLTSLLGLKLSGISDLAFCVHPKAIEVDSDFRRQSMLAQEFLRKTSPTDKLKKESLFLNTLAKQG